MKSKKISPVAQKLTSISLAIALGSLMIPTGAFAATTADMSVEFSNNAKSATSGASLYFQLPSGMSSGNSLKVQFGDSNTTDFNLTAIGTAGTLQLPPGSATTAGSDGYKSINFAISTEDAGVCTGRAYPSNETLSGSTSATWGAYVKTESSIDYAYVKVGTSIASTKCIRLEVGKNTGIGTNVITNGSTSGSKKIYISSTSGSFPSIVTVDTGTAYVPLVDSGDIAISASVTSSIVLTVPSDTIALGTLSTGSTATASTTAGAIGVNITGGGSGFTLQGYTPAGLSNGSSTLTAQTSQGAGAPGTEGWGISVAQVSDSAGSSTATANANYSDSGQFKISTTSPDTLASSTAATNATYTMTVHANIATNTQQGSYSGAVRITAFGNF